MSYREFRRGPSRNAVIEADNGRLIITMTRKKVRLTLNVDLRNHGTPVESVVASVMLDDDAIDRLILRLGRIRGGWTNRTDTKP